MPIIKAETIMLFWVIERCRKGITNIRPNKIHDSVIRAIAIIVVKWSFPLFFFVGWSVLLTVSSIVFTGLFGLIRK